MNANGLTKKVVHNPSYFPDVTLKSFIQSYLNSDEVTKSNSDVVWLLKYKLQRLLKCNKDNGSISAWKVCQRK